MRRIAGILTVMAFALALAGQEAAQSPAPTTPAASTPATEASNKSTEQATAVAVPTLAPDKKTKAEAKQAFHSGMKLKSSGDNKGALEKFELAASLDGTNVEYITARETQRQLLVMESLQRGNKAMLANKEVAASAEFRAALEIDPTNAYARQRLNDSTWDADKVPSRTLQVVQKSIDPELSPKPGPHDFHYKGDSRNLLVEIGRAYGITTMIDDSVQTKPVRFNVDGVNFADAMNIASQMTKTFWIPLSGSQMYVVADNADNRKNFERLAIRTFYLSDVLTPQELTDTVNALRQILNIRLIQQDTAQSSITIRAPLPLVDAASKLIDSLAGGRPQLMLDVRVYQVGSSLLRQMGTQWPTSFNLFNLNPTLLAGLVPGASDLVNQLIASGGINQGSSQAIQALLAQLQQASQNPLLTTPFATFGGGQSLMGISGSPSLSMQLQVNESDVKNLEHVTLRASQNSPALLRVGQRYPIVNASFAPIYNTAAISKVLGNQTYRAPFPSFSFEDLGLNLKVTPMVHSNTDVDLKIEMNVRTLAGQSVNGVPIINNREFVGSISLKNEESGVVAGLLSKADSLSLNGYPFLSRVPAANFAFSAQNKNVSNDELLIVMTPHIVRGAPQEPIVVQMPAGQ